MANTAIEILSTPDLYKMITLKNQEYKDAIKNGKTFEEVEKMLKEKKELEKELAKMEANTNW